MLPSLPTPLLPASWLWSACTPDLWPNPVLSRSRTSSFHLETDPRKLQSQLDAPTNADEALLAEARNLYEAGRAEACGALCRIFCSRKTKEDILPVYLSRFYIALYYGLAVDIVSLIYLFKLFRYKVPSFSSPLKCTSQNLKGQVLSSIVFNGCDLMKTDLDGVLVLLPQLLKALELILSDLTPKFK